MHSPTTNTVQGRTASPQEVSAPTSLAALPSDIVVHIIERAPRNGYLFFLNLSRVCTLFHQLASPQIASSYFSSRCDSLQETNQAQPEKPFVDLLAKLRDHHGQLTTQDISSLLMAIADKAILLPNRYLAYDCLEALRRVAAVLPEQERAIIRNGIEDTEARFAAQQPNDCRMVRSLRRQLQEEGLLNGDVGTSSFDALFYDAHGVTLPQ